MNRNDDAIRVLVDSAHGQYCPLVLMHYLQGSRTSLLSAQGYLFRDYRLVVTATAGDRSDRRTADFTLGELGTGFKLAMRTLDAFRVSVGAAAVGMAAFAAGQGWGLLNHYPVPFWLAVPVAVPLPWAVGSVAATVRTPSPTVPRAAESVSVSPSLEIEAMVQLPVTPETVRVWPGRKPRSHTCASPQMRAAQPAFPVIALPVPTDRPASSASR